MPSLWNRMTAAYRAFRDPFSADPIDPFGQAPGSSDWGDFATRMARYRLLWSFYQQTAFRSQREWPAYMIANRGMYRAIRDLFGVARQLGEFGVTHIHGGMLDDMAGDGKEMPNCLPIVMDAERPEIREGLAELFMRSRLCVGKDVVTRWGVTLGDSFWEVVDDAEAETIRLNPRHPGQVKWCDTTTEGNVEAYELEYKIADPRKPRMIGPNAPKPDYVKYNEIVTREDSGGYRYQTYLNDGAWAWPDRPDSSYVVSDLPFAPLVKIQNIDTGMGWGEAESASAVTGVTEVADLSSCLTDWARKAFHAPHLISGMDNPNKRSGDVLAMRPSDRTSQDSDGANDKIRQEENFMWGGRNNANVGAHSLVHDIPVGDIGLQVDRLRSKNLRDYPQLAFLETQLAGNASGESFRECRKPAEAVVVKLRMPYDAGLVQALGMCLTLGKLRDYEHYQGIDASAFERRQFDFRIGSRPAFAVDSMDKYAEMTAKGAAVSALVNAGVPLAKAMAEAGYSKQEITEAMAEKQKAADEALAMAQAKGGPAFGGNAA